MTADMKPPCFMEMSAGGRYWINFCRLSIC